jgi:starvation-inducible DNA-binding protein
MPRMYETRNDLPSEVRDKVAGILNQELADAFDLYSQTKQAHWNVKGRDFYQLHELFDDLATSILGYVDPIAERVTALGVDALGTARMAAASSRLPEYPEDITDGEGHVRALADRYAAFGASLRQGIDVAGELGDQDTADLFTEVSRDVDKHLWFLEAHLQA